MSTYSTPVDAFVCTGPAELAGRMDRRYRRSCSASGPSDLFAFEFIESRPEDHGQLALRPGHWTVTLHDDRPRHLPERVRPWKDSMRYPEIQHRDESARVMALRLRRQLRHLAEQLLV